MADKIFPKGFSYSTPRQGAPDFVLAGVSIKVDEFAEWAREHMNERGWVKIDIKKSKQGKIYAELDTYAPQKPTEPVRERHEEELPGGISADDIPF